MSENWKRWLQALKIYFTASGIGAKSDEVKIAACLHIGGEQMIAVYNTFEWAEDEEKTFENVEKKFKDHCEPRKNMTYLRHKFFSRRQGDDETIDHYVTDLKNLAKDCELAQLEQELTKDILVLGVNSNTVRNRLLRIDDLKLDKAVDICRANEVAATQMQSLNQDSKTDSVNAVGQDKSYHCGKCAKRHKPRQCPAYGQKCNKCSRYGHFAKACRSQPNSASHASSSQGQGGAKQKQGQGRRRNGKKSSKQKVNTVDAEDEAVSSSEENSFFVGLVN